MTKNQFVALNPERHGRDSTGKCFVCGDTPASGRVFCKKHLRSYTDKQYYTIWEWAARHPDFNGVGRALVNGITPDNIRDWLAPVAERQ